MNATAQQGRRSRATRTLHTIIDIAKLPDSYTLRNRRRTLSPTRNLSVSDLVKAYAPAAPSRREDFSEVSLVQVSEATGDPLLKALSREVNRQWLMLLSVAAIGLLVAVVLSTPLSAILAGSALAVTGCAIFALVNGARRASPVVTVLYIAAGSLLFYEIIDLFARTAK